jgi:hypothetical protein
MTYSEYLSSTYSIPDLHLQSRFSNKNVREEIASC